MCRYGFKNYKITYGCFKCQVGFKRPLLEDGQWKLNAKKAGVSPLASGAIVAKDFKCPNCGGPMANLGRDLRLPVKTKNEQWKCIKYLYDNKYNIYSCGCQGIGFVPHKMEDAVQLVEDYKNKIPDYYKQQALHEKAAALEKKRKQNADTLRTKKLLRAVKKEK